MNTTSFKKDLDTALKAINGISFTIDHQKESEGDVFEVKFNYSGFKGAGANWDKKVDETLKRLWSEWGGSFYWDGNVVYFSFEWIVLD